MKADFVAGVLEGFEGTLDDVLDRVTDPRLKGEVEALQRHIASKRHQLEAAKATEPSTAVS